MNTTQRIRLSEYAWKILKHDHSYWGEREKFNRERILNTVFQNYYEQAQASVCRRLAEKKEELEKTLAGCSAPGKEAIIRELLEHEKIKRIRVLSLNFSERKKILHGLRDTEIERHIDASGFSDSIKKQLKKVNWDQPEDKLRNKLVRLIQPQESEDWEEYLSQLKKMVDKVHRYARKGELEPEKRKRLIEDSRTYFCVDTNAESCLENLVDRKENWTVIQAELETVFKPKLQKVQEDWEQFLQQRNSLTEQILRLCRDYSLETEKKPLTDEKIIGLHQAVRKILETSREVGTPEGIYYKELDYFETVIEEYCRLPMNERERIYYRERFDKISAAVRRSERLIVKTNGKEYMTRPYKIIADAMGNKNYLVAFSTHYQGNQPESPSSFLIMRIQEVQSGESFQWTSSELKQIQDKLQDCGVEYMIGDIKKIRIRFTPYGRKMYQNILYMRPECEKWEEETAPDGSLISMIGEFRCTKRQAENYFFKFGEHAEILEPESLRKTFRTKFTWAAGLYQMKK